jgi:hypothetical protein
MEKMTSSIRPSTSIDVHLFVVLAHEETKP